MGDHTIRFSKFAFSLYKSPSSKFYWGVKFKIGAWYPVAERLSRWARIELLRLLLDVGMRKKDISDICKVTPAAISHWINKSGHHPSDEATIRLLGVAWGKDPERVKSILKSEADRFMMDLEKIGIDFTGV